MALLLLLDHVDVEVLVVETDHVATENLPLTFALEDALLDHAPEEVQRHVTIAGHLHHLQVELEQFLQTADQLQQFVQLHLRTVQADLQIVDVQQFQQRSLQVLQLLNLVEGKVERDPLQGLETGDGLDDHVDLPLGEVVVLEVQVELLQGQTARDGQTQIVDHVVHEVGAVVQVEDLAEFGQGPSRALLVLDVVLVHDQGELLDRQTGHLLSQQDVLLLAEDAPLPTDQQGLQEGTLRQQSVQQKEQVLKGRFRLSQPQLQQFETVIGHDTKEPLIPTDHLIGSQINPDLGETHHRRIIGHTHTLLVHSLDVDTFALDVLEVVKDVVGATGQQGNALRPVKFNLRNTQHEVLLLLQAETFRQSRSVLFTDVYYLLHFAKYIVHGLHLLRRGGRTTNSAFDGRGRLAGLADLEGVAIGRSFGEVQPVELASLEETDLVAGLRAEVTRRLHHAGRLQLLLLPLEPPQETRTQDVALLLLVKTDELQLLESRTFELVELQSHPQHLANGGVPITQLLGLLHPLLHDLPVRRLLNFHPFVRLELLKGHHVEHHQPEAENVALEGVAADQLLAAHPHQLRGQERHSAQNGGVLTVPVNDLATAHVTETDGEALAVHYKYIFGFDIAVRDVYLLEGCECLQDLFQDTDHLASPESAAVASAFNQKLFEVLFGALHEDEGVLLLVVLVALHLGEEVAVVLDEPLALLAEFLHETDLPQEVLVLVVVLDLYLLQGQGLATHQRREDVGVPVAQLLLHTDVRQSVVALQHNVVCEKIKHYYYTARLDMSKPRGQKVQLGKGKCSVWKSMPLIHHSPSAHQLNSEFWCY